MSKHRIERGFTLVELMVVVVILAILATVAVASYGKYKRNARRSEGVSAVNDIRMKQETFYATYSRYEDSTGGDETAYTGDKAGTGDEWHGLFTWEVTCPDATNAWCNLGFTPPLHNIDGNDNISYFQYQTIGWAPGRTEPASIEDGTQRWLHVEARGLPASQSEWVNCSVIRYTNEADDTLVWTEQDCP